MLTHTTRSKAAHIDQDDSDVRTWLTDSVRDRINRGEYDIDKMLDSVLDRLADDLGVTLRDDDSQ